MRIALRKGSGQGDQVHAVPAGNLQYPGSGGIDRIEPGEPRQNGKPFGMGLGKDRGRIFDPVVGRRLFRQASISHQTGISAH